VTREAKHLIGILLLVAAVAIVIAMTVSNGNAPEVKSRAELQQEFREQIHHDAVDAAKWFDRRS
jgi:hypothetical protein